MEMGQSNSLLRRRRASFSPQNISPTSRTPSPQAPQLQVPRAPKSSQACTGRHTPPEVHKPGFADLPNEILDRIFSFLQRHELSAFLSNRGTYGAAIRAIWGHVDLSLPLNEIYSVCCKNELSRRKERFGHCVRARADERLEYTYRLTIFADHKDDIHGLIPDLLGTCTNLTKLEVLTYGSVHPKALLTLPCTVRFLTTDRPDLFRMPLLGDAGRHRATKPLYSRLDHLVVKTNVYRPFKVEHVGSDSVWCNVRRFRCEMFSSADGIDFTNERRGLLSLEELETGLSILADEATSRNTLRSLEFAPAGCISRNQLSLAHSAVAHRAAKIQSLLLRFPALQVVLIPQELLLKCLDAVGPRLPMTFEVSVKLCDLVCHPRHVKGVNRLLGLKAFLDMLPGIQDCRRIRVVLDVDAEDLSPRKHRRMHGYGGDWIRWIEDRLSEMGAHLVRRTLDAAPFVGQRRFFHTRGVKLAESTDVVTQWLRRSSRQSQAVDGRTERWESDLGEDVLSAFFDLA
ncbi:uncharacterized protein PV09_07843 [Verruconis gallopava]|uniref:F-box domain-containing protein n=1 Tax=Verruconis gallopava TaxID=253628 RepID=A0A0D1XEN6_9PEZI|nr:uncharacterized protein PV09_07843 [Verruconis gallopava]KIW00656.1 hypothetical protein PV09_07843 [Verruconis gallopava]